MYIISEHRIFLLFFLFGEVILGSDKIPLVPPLFFLYYFDLTQKMLQANESAAMY